MAAITRRLLHLHLRTNPNPYPRPHPYYHLQHFSSSSSDPDPPSETPRTEPDPLSGSTKAPPSFSSYFSEVKASLRRESPPPQAPPRKPLSFSNRGNPTPPSPPSPPSKAASLEEIRRNLSEFRQRSAAPPPPTAGGQNGGAYVSMQELYSRNVNSENSGGDYATSDSPKLGFDAIRDSLRQLKSPAAKNRSDSGVRAIDPLSLARFKESLKMKAEPDANLGSGMFFGGSDSSPPIFDDKVGEKGAMRTEFVRLYNHQDLGRKLRNLRPEKKKGKWFSLQELNERLVKLREIEEKEREAMSGVGAVTKDLRESLVKLSMSTAQKGRKSTLQRLDILGQLGGTPDYLSPPKEELVEKYFHPDNMSSAEKLKLELKKVRDEFKMSESDCGSARVQVAQLTTKIKHLSNVLQKKDKHSRKGLQAMVQRRKKLLKYLRRTDWDSYCLVLSKLGLRDNPDIKA